MIADRDGVHPGWEGHLVMAYAFLRTETERAALVAPIGAACQPVQHTLRLEPLNWRPAPR